MGWFSDRWDDVKDLGSKIDDEIFQPIKEYAAEGLTVVGTALGGPVGAAIGGTIGGLIEGDDLGDALKGGAVSGLTSFALGGPGGGSGTTFSLPSGGDLLSTLKDGAGAVFNSAKEFLASPIQTIKDNIPSLSDLSDSAIDKVKAELERLPENAVNAVLDRLKGAKPEDLGQILNGGGSLSDVLGTIGSGVIANNANKDILDLNREQFNTAVDLQRETRDLNLARSEPFAQAGVDSLGQLQDAAGQPVAATGSTLDQVNPLVSFLRNEGFTDIQESAAAKGRLNSGGTLRDLVRFNSDLTSTVVPQLQQQQFNENLARQQNQFGQLFDVSRLGSNAVAGQNTTAANAANNIGNLGQSFANSQSNNLANKANTLTGTLQDLIVR